MPDPHRLINIMYCFSLSPWAVLAWHKTHNMFGMLLYAQREKAATEKETNPGGSQPVPAAFYQQYAVHHSNFMMMPLPRP